MLTKGSAFYGAAAHAGDNLLLEEDIAKNGRNNGDDDLMLFIGQQYFE